jgi:hypothetical protein
MGQQAGYTFHCAEMIDRGVQVVIITPGYARP